MPVQYDWCCVMLFLAAWWYGIIKFYLTIKFLLACLMFWIHISAKQFKPTIPNISSWRCNPCEGQAELVLQHLAFHTLLLVGFQCCFDSSCWTNSNWYINQISFIDYPSAKLPTSMNCGHYIYLYLTTILTSLLWKNIVSLSSWQVWLNCFALSANVCFHFS